MIEKEYTLILRERIFEFSGGFEKSIKAKSKKDWILAMLMLAVPITITIIFVLSAIIFAFTLTFFEGDNVKKMDYVGMKNWKNVFDKNFENSLKNTLLFTGITTTINISLALMVATVLNTKQLKGKNIFLALYFLPAVTSPIAVVLVFSKLVSPTGLIKIDYISPGQGSKAIWIIIMASIWSGACLSIVSFNTAFTNLGNIQHEMASIEGAGWWTRFIKITIPSLGPILSYVLITQIIIGMGVFDLPLVLSLIGLKFPSLSTVAFLGYSKMIDTGLGGSAIKNIGAGMTILFALSIIIASLTFASNKIKPLEGEGK